MKTILLYVTVLLIISFAACVAGDFRVTTDADGNIVGAGFDRAEEEKEKEDETPKSEDPQE